jgi:VWFA-related protein
MRRFYAAFMTAACALASFGRAQTPPTFRTSTRLVEVNVIATDKSGPVEGLTKDDFEVYDNGKKQRIAVFEAARRDVPASAQPSQPSPIPLEFTNRPAPGVEQQNATIIVWDTLNTAFGDQIRAKKAVLDSLRVVRPGDHIGVYILGSYISVLQDFTSNSAQLAATLERYTAWPDIGFVMAERKLQLTQRAQWQIRNHLARVPGRKSVVWISAAAPLYLYGAEFAVYVVDARGLPGFPEMQAENREPKSVDAFSWGPNSKDSENMKRIAASTGGQAFTYTNDIRGAIDRAMTDANVTYTLAFYAEEAKPGSQPYRRLRVQVKRRGVEAHYRTQYRANPYEPTPQQRVAEALLSPLDSTQIAITAKVERNASKINVPVTIGAEDIVFTGSPSRRTGAVDLIVSQRAAGGAQLATTSRSLAIEVDGSKFEQFLKQGIQAAVEAEPQPGLTEVKVVALDRTSGHTGTLTIPIADQRR